MKEYKGDNHDFNVALAKYHQIAHLWKNATDGMVTSPKGIQLNPKEWTFPEVCKQLSNVLDTAADTEEDWQKKNVDDIITELNLLLSFTNGGARFEEQAQILQNLIADHEQIKLANENCCTKCLRHIGLI